MHLNPKDEWLETDGLGGYAMGRVDGVPTRRYHSLLTVATTPPTGRVTLVNAVDAVVETADGAFSLSSMRYAPDVTHPDGSSRLVAFTGEPWPTWTYRLPDGLEVIQELVQLHGAPVTAMSWRLSSPTKARLTVRPFLSVRDSHGTTHENASFARGSRVSGQRIDWQPYTDMPAVVAVTNGDFLGEPDWYRNVQYDDERARGFDYLEDLASPGRMTFDLAAGRAVVVFSTVTAETAPLLRQWAPRLWTLGAESERSRRARFPSPLHRAADAFLVRRSAGRTVIAGYPWFSDWGRDTFIALRGLCIAGDRLDVAKEILLEWGRHVSSGMLPNFFPEAEVPPEYNSVDASLWFVIAVFDLMRVAEPRGLISDSEVDDLRGVVEAIVTGYAHGTRFGIQMEASGLLRAGTAGVQLTWMDAKVGVHVVTGRTGKPVEVQALWINALRIAGRWDRRWIPLAESAERSFAEQFWNEAKSCLFDVVDVDHQRGRVDASIRPNQIFAVGGLPYPLMTGVRARRIVDTVERRLWTPAGPRSLAPDDPAYRGRYAGNADARDAAYHQGTVWPWLAGPFIEAWVSVRGGTDRAKADARRRLLNPLVQHYAGASPGHLWEIADGDAPHLPNGCPFQAWSVGEMLRLTEQVLLPARPTVDISVNGVNQVSTAVQRAG